MICANLACRKEIQVTESYHILAFDRPYINLYFHPKCLIGSEEDATEIVRELIKEQNESTSNKRNWVRRGGPRI